MRVLICYNFLDLCNKILTEFAWIIMIFHVSYIDSICIHDNKLDLLFISILPDHQCSVYMATILTWLDTQPIDLHLVTTGSLY